MATHSSTFAWKIPWTEEGGRLQPVGLQSRTRLSDFTFFSLYICRESSMYMDFPGVLDGKESACKAQDLSEIPGSGRSPREGNGDALQSSCLENARDRGAWRAAVRGVAESDSTERLTFSLFQCVHVSPDLPVYPSLPLSPR